MRSLYTMILFITIAGSSIYGQNENQLIIGKVSFVTSRNVYVKFVETGNIQPGDSLRFMNQITPCLLVKSKSSSSVVCISLNSCKVKKGDEVYFGYNIHRAEEQNISNSIDKRNDTIKTTSNKNTESDRAARLRGRLSVGGFGSISNVRDNRYGIQSNFSMSAEHINNSKFSFYSYLNYRQNFISGDTDYSRKTKFFNVYDFAVKYDVDPTLSVVLGRKINPKMSSVGAIDGVQVEKYFGKNFVGVIAGFRPDIFDYSFNSDLFEYGAYYGRLSDIENFRSESTIGFIEQRNSGEIDRRYLYFQHSSTVGKKLSLFASTELDIYDKVGDTISNDIRLTNLYVSARYRFNRKVNAMISYDSRKRIVYYETFKSEIERLLDEDIARQGLRMRVNVRPLKNLMAGLGYSKRFQNDTQNKSDNWRAYATYSRLPAISGNISVNYNMNTSNYLKSNILSARYSRSVIENKLDVELSYRLANFDYFNSFTPAYSQQYYGLNMSLRISRKLFFSAYGEIATGSREDNYRIYTKLIKRF